MYAHIVRLLYYRECCDIINATKKLRMLKIPRILSPNYEKCRKSRVSSPRFYWVKAHKAQNGDREWNLKTTLLKMIVHFGTPWFKNRFKEQVSITIASWRKILETWRTKKQISKKNDRHWGRKSWNLQEE